MKDIVNIGGDYKYTELVIDFSDNEHIEDLLLFCKGWQKFSPVLGAEAGKFTNANNLERLKTEAERNLIADGVMDIDVWIDEELNVNGTYSK